MAEFVVDYIGIYTERAMIDPPFFLIYEFSDENEFALMNQFMRKLFKEIKTTRDDLMMYHTDDFDCPVIITIKLI